MSRPLRVVIADDHPFYRKGLVRALSVNGIEVVAEAPNGEAAIRAVEDTRPDVVVMDLKMPGVSGLEATRVLTKRSLGSRVLVLSVSDEDEDVVDAMLAGASGYVLKERSVEEVIAGIRAAAAGAPHLSPRIAMLLLQLLCEPGGVGVDVAGVPLSMHERGVLELVAEGRREREIAGELAIPETAIEEIAVDLVTKLTVADRLAGALRAHQRRRGWSDV